MIYRLGQETSGKDLLSLNCLLLSTCSGIIPN